MARFKKSMAIAMALVMAGSMAYTYPGNKSGIQRVYAAEADADVLVDESQTADIAASSGLGVAAHTQDQIITYIKNSGALLTDEVQYETAYSDKTPYDPGSLTDETLNSALATLNIVRYIAGLNYDVTLDSSYNEQSQAAALINQINGSLSHSPTRPDGMSDSLYSLANTGCGRTNLASGSANLNTCIVNSWMNDSSPSNLSHVGHRSWCLNPKMGKTGFGAAGNCMAMYSMNSSNSSNIKNIAWPAQNMPVEYMSSNMAWSLFTGQSETSSSVNVTLERASDGKTWTFSEESADGYFNVSDYIHNGTIVFRPSDIDGYNDGDVFTVNVTGVKTPVTYTVTFFTIGELGHVHTFNGAFKSTPDFTNMTAEVSAKCDGCGKTFTDSVDITITSSGVSCGYSGSLWYSFRPKFAGKTYNASASGRVTSLPHLNGEPTFTWSGTECTASQTCSRCGEVTTTPCTVTSTTTATCTSAGTTTYTATLGEYSSVKTVASAKLSHKFSNYISNDNATCQQDGTKTAECDYGCGTTKTVTDEGSKLAHTPVGEWTVTRKASPEADGAMARKCRVCGETVEGAEIPSIDRMVLDSTRFVYDGKAKKTGVIIYDRTGAEIDASQYTLKFEKNTASGRASVKAVFSGDYKGTLTTYFNILPKGTSIRTLTNLSGGVNITWNKAADGTGYYIYRSTNGGAYTQIAAVNKLTTTSYTDKTAKTNGARYLYKVCVYRKNASLILKSSASAPKTIYYVAVPTCRSAANSAAGSVKVNYAGNTKVTGYQIQYALNMKFTGAKTVTAAGYKTTTKVITKLQKNKKYYVRVRGYKKVNGVIYYSAWSAAKSAVVKK